ncbi:hypothetical protein GCM10010430_15330 [Kitasatospora cystarginea]|uniref:Tyr recombinase domain-containing protein n=1 Tax=Kitasatospora cystarginea TaxID=58350 RepID=A0ABP5QHZ3_9ACTN
MNWSSSGANSLTADEARTFPTSTNGHRVQALFELALRTGPRKGELLGLHWEDLDLDAGTASIRRTLQRTRTSGLTTLPTNGVWFADFNGDSHADCLYTNPDNSVDAAFWNGGDGKGGWTNRGRVASGA